MQGRQYSGSIREELKEREVVIMYKIAILIVIGLAVLGTGDAKGTIIEFHMDGIIQHGDDFDLVEIFDGATVVMVGGP